MKVMEGSALWQYSPSLAVLLHPFRAFGGASRQQ
jgi:hypothetical protein